MASRTGNDEQNNYSRNGLRRIEIVEKVTR